MTTPKKSLGQHFLTSEGAIQRIINSADIQTGECVLEIGPGKGVLTDALLKSGAQVIAIEKDDNLATNLTESYINAISDGTLTIHNADICKTSPSTLINSPHGNTDYKLVANIPYNITGAIIRQFLTATNQPTKMVLLVQKEVAERIIARNGKENILSISVKAYGEPYIEGVVKSGSFNPPPKVDSAILVIEHISRTFFNTADETLFFTLLRTGFQSKRKQLKNNLSSILTDAHIPELFHTCAIHIATRPEDLTVHDWRCLTKTISSFV